MLGSRRLIIQRAVTRLTRSGGSRPELRLLDAQFQNNDVGMAFAESRPARHSQSSRNPFHAGDDFRGYLVHTFATACQVARPPVRI
jgi:hypothetical protein